MNQIQPPWGTDSSADPLASNTSSALRRELGIVSRGRRLVGVSLAVCLTFAALYNYGSRPIYQSVSVVSLDEAGVSALKVRGSVDQTRKAAALAEQVRLLQSAELALVAVSANDPVISAELALGPLGDWRDRIAEEARVRLGFPRVYGTAPPDLVRTFRSRLSVDYEPPATWVYVRFNAYDPNAAAAAVNRLMDQYLTETQRETAGAAGASRKELEDKVTKRQDRVAETLGKLQEFEDKEGLQNLDTRRSLLEKELARLQDSLITARQNRLTRHALFEESQRLSVNDLVSIPQIRDDREVSEAVAKVAELEARMSQVTTTLGDRHPEVQSIRSELDFSRKRLTARLGALREGLARDYRAAVREEGDVGAAVQGAQAGLSRLDRNSVEHTFIQKQAEAGQRAVGELIAKSVRESDEEVFFAPKVLQRGEPATAPLSPQRTRNFQYAVVIGLIVGLSLAWLRSHLDETLKTPEEVKAAIGLPLLGMVPRVKTSNFDLFAPEQGAATRLFEAYRVLRTNLTMGDDDPKANQLLLLTSSREAEGKTTTSCGLGVTLALAGLRVLLIDGDLRRASLSRLLSAGGRRGLTDAVDGRALDRCIFQTAIPGLSLMPSGTARENPAEVLNRESLQRVVAQIRSDYDWIICDAPPVLAVADAAILCRLADSVLVVIGANSTPLGSVRATLDQLSAVGAKVRGLVLNNVDLSRDSHYYRYYYSAQYAGYADKTKSTRSKALTAPQADRG